MDLYIAYVEQKWSTAHLRIYTTMDLVGIMNQQQGDNCLTQMKKNALV